MFIRTTIAALALAGSAAPALAQSREPVSIEVGIADLDLSTARDRGRLDTRIDSAVQKLCRSGMRGTAARVSEMRCVETALASAKPQVEVAIASSRGQVRIAAARPGYGG